MLELDHVVMLVGDLDAAADRLRRSAGLRSIPGGRHPGWGTANRVVPLGGTYLELLGVVDQKEAATDAIGREYLRLVSGGDNLQLWVLRTDDLDGVAHRLGLPIQAKSRRLPDGGEVAWRTAGLAAAVANPTLPFFIEWGVPPERHPGRMPCDQDVPVDGIAWVQVGADPAELARWLGGASLPVRLGGPARANAVGIATGAGEIEIR